MQILLGAGLGCALGLFLRERAGPLGDVGLLVIRLLKALATPLILLAVLDAFLRTSIPARSAARLVGLSALNAVVAMGLGLGVSNVLRTGERYGAPLRELAERLARNGHNGQRGDAHPTLDPLSSLGSLIPESLVEPFSRNHVIGVVLLAVLFGAALRSVQHGEETNAGFAILRDVVRTLFVVMVRILEWVLTLVPFAVFGIVAQLVGRTGAAVFGVLAAFLATIVLGLLLHALVWYALLLRAVGRVSPVWFFRGAADAIFTALSCSSSLATLPVTLRCLSEKLRISDRNARLAACVGTNLNHDGIILYEAAAALFMAQAFGVHLGASQQVTVALAALMAGVGIAGVPEAGLITLPLVLSAAGLPDHIAALAIPLTLPVDWMLGRARAATNVISDMTVATLLERFDESATPPGDDVAPSARATAE